MAASLEEKSIPPFYGISGVFVNTEHRLFPSGLIRKRAEDNWEYIAYLVIKSNYL